MPIIPDKASYTSEMGGAMIMGFPLSVFEEMGAREGQTFQGPCCPRPDFLLPCSIAIFLPGPLELHDGTTMDGENQETLS